MKEDKTMTTLIAKTFIIMTLIFELITIVTGSALYPVFAAAAAIIFGSIILTALIDKIQRFAVRRAVTKKMFLLS